MEKIGVVSYKLQLLASSLVHPVFHISQRKKAIRNYHNDPNLPLELEEDAEQVIVPEKVLSWRIEHVGGQQTCEWLIKWKGMDIADTTWEDEVMLGCQVPSFSLEDMANLEGG